MADKLRSAREIARLVVGPMDRPIAAEDMAAVIRRSRREGAEWMRERAKAQAVVGLCWGDATMVEATIDAIDVGEMG